MATLRKITFPKPDCGPAGWPSAANPAKFLFCANKSSFMQPDINTAPDWFKPAIVTHRFTNVSDRQLRNALTLRCGTFV